MANEWHHSGISQPTPLFAIEARRQLESGRTRQAIDTCKRGLARFPEHAAGYVILAAAYRNLGEERRARLVLSRGHARTGVAGLLSQLESVQGSAKTAELELSPKSAQPPPHEAPAAQQLDDAVEPAGSVSLLEDTAAQQLDAAAVSIGRDAEVPGASTGPGGSSRLTDAPVAFDSPGPDVIASDEHGGCDPVSVEPQSASAGELAQPVSHETEPSTPPASQETFPTATEILPRETGSGSSDESVPVQPPRKPAPSLQLHERSSRGRAPVWFPRRSLREDTSRPSNLALHSALGAHRIRSANLRLIPGLEFAPLRHEEPNGRRNAPTEADPPMPDWGLQHRYAQRPETSSTRAPLAEESKLSVPMTGEDRPGDTHAEAPTAEALSARPEESPLEQPPADGAGDQNESATELERLARRLEGARIPPVAEAHGRGIHVFEPSIVSDTLAEILVAQGAFGEALKAYQTLARMRPDRVEYYEDQIASMRRLISGDEQPNTRSPDN